MSSQSSASDTRTPGNRHRAETESQLPKSTTFTFRVRSEGRLDFGGSVTPFETAIDYVADVTPVDGQRRVSWSPSTSGENPGDDEIHKLRRDGHQILGTFLTGAAGGVPASDWTEEPVFVLSDMTPGETWRTSGVGTGRYGSYSTRDEMDMTVRVERESTIDVRGKRLQVFDLRRVWTMTRHDARRGVSYTRTTEQLDRYSPEWGITICAVSDARDPNTAEGAVSHSTATIADAKDCLPAE